MTKFSSLEDPGFIDVYKTLLRWILDIQKQVIHWLLQSLDSQKRWERIQQIDDAYKGTCSWIFDPDLPFQKWLCQSTIENSPFFWIQGRPGSGKSTLMKKVLIDSRTQEYLSLCSSRKWNLIPFFFHDRGSRVQKSINGLLQDILYGLLDADKSLSRFIKDPVIRKAFLRAVVQTDSTHNAMLDFSSVVKAHEWSTKGLADILKALLSQDEVELNVLFFIDALDEHSGNHRNLLSTINSCLVERSSPKVKVKLCVASRAEPIFRIAFQDVPTLEVHLYTKGDIRLYAHEQIRLYLNEEDGARDAEKLDALTTEITDKASGMFIWVRIVVEELIERLIDGYTVVQLREILLEIPEELQDLYRRVLSRIKPQYALHCYVLFQIFLCMEERGITAQTILTVTEVVVHHKYESIPAQAQSRKLASYSGGLIELVKNSSKPQLIHQTVRTFLKDSHSACHMVPQISEPLQDGMAYLTAFCVHVAVRERLHIAEDNGHRLLCLFNYAAETETMQSEDLVKMLDRLSTEPDCSDELKPIFANAIDYTIDGLHVIQEIASNGGLMAYHEEHPWLSQGLSLNSKLFPESQSSLPREHTTLLRPYDILSAAISSGVLPYAENKLSSGLLPTTMMNRAPLLHYAVTSSFITWQYVSSGYYERRTATAATLIRLCISQGADPNTQYNGMAALGFLVSLRPTSMGRPISIANWTSIFKTMTALLEAGADPNEMILSGGRFQRSLLSYVLRLASTSDDNALEMVRTLLEHGANTNLADADGFRPLFFALDRVHIKAAKLLLEFGADPGDLGNGRVANTEKYLVV
ncbi:uncharacterized protein KY384_001824 [Bacidia gigantensis]|uniref:uncharacterized protein n=1 Tax=Bacidia gigantensis TaxID=2732470 RepID=UPI001D03C18C|nr:uncharacterized protein KY384_001824 [Bacidia gigantensis]KAG8533041.1 hypothetical protein KY384_001824 [Bacidia gigantensis]